MLSSGGWWQKSINDTIFSDIDPLHPGTICKYTIEANTYENIKFLSQGTIINYT